MKLISFQYFKYGVVFFFLSFATGTQAQKKECSTPSDNLSPFWSDAEHLHLASRGFQNACRSFKERIKYCQTTQIPRKDKVIALNYAQIVTLGDYYLKEEMAFEENGHKEISNPSLEKIFKCIDKEGRVHKKQRRFPNIKYPSCEWIAFLNSRNLFKILTSNIEHFGWYNMTAYVRSHQKALELAQRAGQLKNSGEIEKSDQLFRKSLYINAFADHFLTDAFAAGHIRTPRKQLKIWAQKNFHGFFKKYKGDLLSMILHDTESLNSKNQEIGFLVKNSLGDIWKTRSDKKLNQCRKESHLGIQLPTEAVEASLNEIFEAYLFQRLPHKTFLATEFVPFPTDQGLSNKIKQLLKKEGLKKLSKRFHKQIRFPLRLFIRKKNVKKMLLHIHEIMAQFQKDIQKDISQIPLLKKRLPKAYLQAYKNINDNDIEPIKE